LQRAICLATPWLDSRGSFDREARTLRSRHDALVRRLDRALAAPVQATPRRLVQIYDGGSMPTSPDSFYLSYPVELNGVEIEGGMGSPVVDTTQTIPVVVLGHAPSAGEFLTAYAVGGRWVAERGGPSGGGTLPCSPCNIPKHNLTLSWINSLIGNGSATLTYTHAPASWTSGCSHGLQFKLLCTGGQVELRVIYWTSGACPGPGQIQYCSNLRAMPFGLTISSYTCSPFSVTFLTTSGGCPAITSSGYTQFTITL
jgi:hypothetical protein